MTRETLPKISVDLKSLPSRGLSYAKDAAIVFYPYTFGEIKKISQTNTETKDIVEAIDFVLSGIECTNLKSADITLSDYNYIAVLRKLSSLGDNNPMKLTWKCPECKKSSVSNFSLSQVEYEDLKAKKLPLKVTFDNTEFVFNVLTVGKYKELLPKLEKYNTDIASLAMEVTNMDFEDAYEKLSSLYNSDDLEVLAEIDKLLFHDIKDIEVTCKSKTDGKECGFKATIPFSWVNRYISTESSNKKVITSRIQFGS